MLGLPFPYMSLARAACSSFAMFRGGKGCSHLLSSALDEFHQGLHKAGFRVRVRVEGSGLEGLGCLASPRK